MEKKEEEKIGFEKRRARRVKVRFPVWYQPISKEKKPAEVKETFARDISTSGISFETREMYPIGTKMKITFHLPGVKPLVHAMGRTTRLEEVKKGERFIIGVSFEKIEDEDRLEILQRIERMDIALFLDLMAEKEASDLHLTFDRPPILRVHGNLRPTKVKQLDKDEIKHSIYSIMSDEQIERFERTKELDFSFTASPESRFRVNVHQQRGFVEAAFRRIPIKVPTIDEYNLPPVLKDLARKRAGFVIIPGPTGSGKSTTLAAMVDLINKEREVVIICIEDPIEYLHTSRKSVIKQREVGSDTTSFAEALKRALRQDPDVILVGEIRDAETMRTALTAAETGHLVLASIHAPDTIQTIDRAISFFPREEQELATLQLSGSLQGIVAQILLPRKDGKGRVLATEVLVATDAVRNLIRERKTHQIISVLQTSVHLKMHTMEDSLKKLVDEGLITKEIALEHCKGLAKAL